jgi:hypothetical protein
MRQPKLAPLFFKEGNLVFALTFSNSWPLFSEKYRTYGLAAYVYALTPIPSCWHAKDGGSQWMGIAGLIPSPTAARITLWRRWPQCQVCFADGNLRVFAEIQYHPTANWLLAIMYDVGVDQPTIQRPCEAPSRASIN